MSTTRINGIDISKFQTARGVVDFGQVKCGGYDFVIVRIGWGGYAGEIHWDPHLDRVIRDANAAGVHVGLYVYTYATGAAAARVTAQEAIQFARQYPGLIDYPICFDVEETNDKCLVSQGRAKLTDTVLAFCDEVQKQGYYPMWYTYSAFVQQYLDYSRLKAYDFWQADYRADPADYERGIWQFVGNDGRCPGVVGACDNNYAYKDYAEIIRSGGWNGFEKAAGGGTDGKPAGDMVPRTEYDALAALLEETEKRYDALAGSVRTLAQGL